MITSATQVQTTTSDSSNFGILPQEIAFLAFSMPIIWKMVKPPIGVIFFSYAEEAKKCFTSWVEKEITHITFDPEKLDLKIIIVSLWNKTHAFVRDKVEQSKDPKAIEMQNNALAAAEKAQERYNNLGLEGKVFTCFQAMVIAETLEHLIKKKPNVQPESTSQVASI